MCSEECSGDMMRIFDQMHAIGSKVHVWRRQKLPNRIVFTNISYSSWCSFRDYIDEAYVNDSSASFKWIDWDKESESKPLECLHIKSGYTFAYSGYENEVKMFFDYQSKPELKELFITRLEALQEPPTNTQIGLLTMMNGSLRVTYFPYRQYEHDVIPYLGNEFEAFRESMMNQIESESKKGLYLLYGDPGTGKTSFIKSVLSNINRQAIFITPSMAVHLASPEMIALLSNYPGSVLIIEDAEKILMKREGDNSNAVSTILNLSDGFTSDFLNLNIICTFNTKISEIDPALLRKGRLKGMQEFKKLKQENIVRMVDEVGLDIEVKEDMTLADVFNNDKTAKSRNSNKMIGFINK
jgi:hypothetical protein